MANEGGSWFILKDADSSPYFNGHDIYCYVESMKLSGGQSIGNSQIQGVNPEIDPTLDGNDSNSLGSMYDRRMGYNSYASFNSPIITLKGNWATDIGSQNTLGSLLSPFKLFKMSHSSHKYILKGGNIISNLVNGELGSGYYVGEGGLPVVFLSPWSLDEDYNRGTNKVEWNATFRLDRRD